MEDQIDISDTNVEEVDQEVEGGVGWRKMALRERPRKDLVRKRQDRSSLSASDEISDRDKRRPKRSLGGTKSTPYDEYGHLRFNGADICDCMNTSCPGCWYECEKCGSNKCGACCRVNRKFYYENMTFDGKDMTILNPHIPPK